MLTFNKIVWGTNFVLGPFIILGGALINSDKTVLWGIGICMISISMFYFGQIMRDFNINKCANVNCGHIKSSHRYPNGRSIFAASCRRCQCKSFMPRDTPLDGVVCYPEDEKYTKMRTERKGEMNGKRNTTKP